MHNQIIGKLIYNIEMFFVNLQFIGYMAVFQGLNPVLGLTVNNFMEQPDGTVVPINYVDDGTGK